MVSILSVSLSIPNTVRDSKQTDRVPLQADRISRALPDMAGRDGAVRAYVVWFGFQHLAKNRAPDFHRLLEIFAFYAPGSIVP
jgi:hypothetical protein